MQALPPAERKEFVDQKAKERADLQARIIELNAAREKYVAARMKEIAGTNTLDNVVITTVRGWCTNRGFGDREAAETQPADFGA